MKQLLIAVVTLSIVSCMGKSGNVKAKFIPKADTVKTLGVYAAIPYKTINYGIMYVIINHTAQVDSMLNAKQFNDSIPLFLPENDSVYRRTIMAAVSFDFNLDSAFAKVARWVKVNDKKLLTDSTKIRKQFTSTSNTTSKK